LILLVVATAACPPAATPGEDAGWEDSGVVTTPDAGRPDAGARDGAGHPDAGHVADSAVRPDAGTAGDDAGSRDAGLALDAASPPDARPTEAEAGWQDAGHAVDAATPWDAAPRPDAAVHLPPAGSQVAIMGELTWDVAQDGTLTVEQPLQGWVVSAQPGVVIHAQLTSLDDGRDLRAWWFGPAERGQFTGAARAEVPTGPGGLVTPSAGQYLLGLAEWAWDLPAGYSVTVSCDGEACGPLAASPWPCPPSVVDGIVACADDLLAGEDDTWEPLDALRACSDAEPMARQYDDACAPPGPRPVFCGVSYATAWQQMVEQCTQDAFTAYAGRTCVFGMQYRDLAEHPRILVLETEDFSAVAGLDSIDQAQAVAAARASYDHVTTAQEALDAVDDGVMTRLRLADRFTGLLYTAWAYHAGDNRYGRIFKDGESEPIATIRDGDVADCTEPPGVAGMACVGPQVCQGLQCAGMANGEGRCADTTPRPGEWAECSAEVPCGPGLTCVGLSKGEQGNCAAAWMTGVFTDVSMEWIPDQDDLGVTRAVAVRGLASVEVDVRLSVVVRHPQAEQLEVSLVNPGGTRVVVYDGARTGPDLVLDTSVLGFPGDESLNGTWTLEVRDRVAGGLGYLEEWALFLSSRWD
jgi:hypothetical protein